MLIVIIIIINIIISNITHHTTCVSHSVPVSFGLCQNEHLEHLFLFVDLQFLILL